MLVLRERGKIEMPELEIVYKKIGTLKRYKKNSRTHSKEQIQQIANSISEFGFTNPILIKKQQIIAGHGRLEAAKLVGLEDLPTISLAGLTDDQVKALVIADNQLALNAGWDLDLLKTEIEELKLAEFDIDLLGFDDDFIDGLFVTEPGEGLTDPDDVPEPPKDPITVLGDIWKMKRQRNTLHPTMKPVELIDMAMIDQPDKKLVYDSFGGSGSTMISCERNHKECRMMELDETFCDVIIKRWQDFTGKEATLESTGKTYKESGGADDGD